MNWWLHYDWPRHFHLLVVTTQLWLTEYQSNENYFLLLMNRANVPSCKNWKYCLISSVNNYKSLNCGEKQPSQWGIKKAPSPLQSGQAQDFPRHIWAMHLAEVSQPFCPFLWKWVWLIIFTQMLQTEGKKYIKSHKFFGTFVAICAHDAFNQVEGWLYLDSSISVGCQNGQHVSL